MSLFVEHVLLGTSALMPEVEKLVKNHTLLLAKVSWDVIFTSFLFASAGCVSRAEPLSIAPFFCSILRKVQT